MKRFMTPSNIHLLLVSLFAVFPLEAQELTSDVLASRLKEYLKTSPWEEIYLHIDRDKYIAGENIWFSIYSIDRETGKTSYRSDIAYVELLSPWNMPITQTRIQLSNGRGEGTFLLPDSVSSGTYTVRAYTNWMKNFLPDNCCMQDIDIYNPFKGSDFRRKSYLNENTGNTFTVRFFPEGGRLMNGTVSRIVTRYLNDHGEGVQFYGIIKDNDGDSITSFRTDRSGYGSFYINAKDGIDYSVSTPGGSFRLPEVIINGFSVAVDCSLNDRIGINITAVGSFIQQPSKTCFLVIQTHGIIDYITSLKINDTVTKITVPRTRLTGGINQIALIGEEGNVLFERMIYSPEKREITLNAGADTIFERREKVTLSLGMRSKTAYQAGTGEISVSVTPAEAASVSQDIDDFMIFGTEYGRTPWSVMKSRIQDLDPDLVDNFLICSESRWIQWQKIISGKPVTRKYRFENNGHYLSVLVKYREENKSDSCDFLYMSIQGKVAEFNYAGRDTAGCFSFILPVDSRKRNLILQPEHADNNMVLEIEPSFSWLLPATQTYKDSFADSIFEVFSELSFNYQASKIYETGFKKEPVIADNYTVQKRRFYGIPEMEILLDDYISLPVMQEVFFELVPGVILRSRKLGYEIKITNPLTGMFYDEPPLVMIDGVIINDLTVLVDLNPELVEKIEVVKTPYLIGDLVLHGIVNVITRSGDFSNIAIPDFAVVLPYRVIDNPSIFTAPDYSEEKSRLSRKPDLRNTLYWDPVLRTDRNGDTGITFWTSDIPGNYTINIQGISGTGEKVSLHKSFVVR